MVIETLKSVCRSNEFRGKILEGHGINVKLDKVNHSLLGKLSSVVWSWFVISVLHAIQGYCRISLGIVNVASFNLSAF